MPTNRFLRFSSQLAICILLVFMSLLCIPAAPILGQTSGDYIIFNPLIITNGQCAPNQIVSDPVSDVEPAHADAIWLSTRLSGQTLSATLKLRDLPDALIFDREGVAGGLEYAWSVIIDTDNNPQTGDSFFPYIGGDMMLSATHLVIYANTPVTLPIVDGVQAKIWTFDRGREEWTVLSDAAISVDPAKNTISLSGSIPGITAISPVTFATFDYNPDGQPQYDSSRCTVSP